MAAPTISYSTPDPQTIPRRLRILSIMQYVGAGLYPFQLALLLWVSCNVVWFVWGKGRSPNMSLVFETLRNQGRNLFPSIAYSVIVAALTLYSGQKMARGKWRMYSVIVAALQCFLVPLGTLLGLATMIALFTESFKRAYSHCGHSQAN
jgi:hypothetical protein